MKQGWEIKKLGEVCESDLGKTLNQSKDKGELRPYLCAINVLWDKFDFTTLKETRFEESELERYSVRKGDLLICEGGDIGRAAIWEYDDVMQYQNALHRVRLNDSVLSRFLLLYLKHLKDSGVLDTKYGKGVTIKHLVKSSLLSIPIPIPPREEQERIVAELDCLSGVIERKREQLRELDALAQSIFYQMFGDPITNEKRWEVKKLGDVCDIYRGGSPRPIEQYLGGNLPWIKIGDAVFGTDIYLTKTKEHIIEEGLKKTRFIHSGSLIFANCGVSLGFARIITFDGCIHDGWLAFDNISNDINKIFLLKSLNFCTQYFRETAPDGTQPNLNTGIMKAFAQIIPPLTLQQEFADKIALIEKQKELIKQSITETEELFNSRMDYYFN